MNEGFLTHLASFVGLVIFLYLASKPIVKILKKKAREVRRDRARLNIALKKANKTLSEYQVLLKKVDKEAKKSILETKNKTEDFLKTEEERMKEYYEKKKSDIDKIIAHDKSFEVKKMQKNVVTLASKAVLLEQSSSQEEPEKKRLN